MVSRKRGLHSHLSTGDVSERPVKKYKSQKRSKCTRELVVADESTFQDDMPVKLELATVCWIASELWDIGKNLGKAG